MITIDINVLTAVFFIARIVAVYVIGLVTVFLVFFPGDFEPFTARGCFWVIINLIAQLFIWNIVHIHWVF